MDNIKGYRMSIDHCLSKLSIEQIKSLIETVEKKITDLKHMIDKNLSATGAELLLHNIFESLEYDIAVMNEDAKTLDKYQKD